MVVSSFSTSSDFRPREPMECCPFRSPIAYRKIPKISPGAYIFQRPCLRGSFLKGPIFGGAYVRREICVSKACNGKEIYHFSFVLLCIRGQIPSTSPPGEAYIRRGDLTGGFLRYDFAGADFRNFTVFSNRGRLRTSQFFFYVINNMRVAESGKKPNFKKSSSLVLIGQTMYSHSKTRKFILKQCRQCVQQSIHLLINFQVFK